MKIIISGVLVLLFMSGCTIKREISPVSKVLDEKVCIVKDTNVRPGFLIAYREALEKLGYRVEVLPVNSNTNMCQVSSTYDARWSWDLAIYMSYAKINVYEDSKLIGSALYDSTRGGGRIFDKFGNGSTMIKSLVKELYPVKIEK